MSRVASLVWRAGERAMTADEQRLAGPGRGEMKPEPSDAPDDAPRDFEQMETHRADGRRRQSRPREDRTSEVREQQQREAVQLQAEGVGAEAMTAEAIRVDVELELLCGADEVVAKLVPDTPPTFARACQRGVSYRWRATLRRMSRRSA